MSQNSKTVGEASNILAKVLDGKRLDELLNSTDIIEALHGFNYLNRVSNLDEETIKVDEGELIRIVSFNGEVTKKYIWLFYDFSLNKAFPININNYNKIRIKANNKAFIFKKKDDLFEKVEETVQNVDRVPDRDNNTLFPEFSILLKGNNEVRITNPNAFKVTVGLRSGEKGKDFVVASNGIASVLVPNGDYEIYFIYSNNPNALFQGDSFSLNNNEVNIAIVKVVGGNYGIKRVK